MMKHHHLMWTQLMRGINLNNVLSNNRHFGRVYYIRKPSPLPLFCRYTRKMPRTALLQRCWRFFMLEMIVTAASASPKSSPGTFPCRTDRPISRITVPRCIKTTTELKSLIFFEMRETPTNVIHLVHH